MMHILHSLILICLSYSVLQAQTLLTLDDVINRVIDNNPTVQIQKTFISITDNNISKANTGQLPEINAVGSTMYTNNFTDINIRTFQPAPAPEEIAISEFGVASLTASAAVEARYVLWDGGTGSYRYKLLEGLSKVERAKQQVIIQQLIRTCSDLYHEVTKIQNQIEILNDQNDLTVARIEKLKDKQLFSKVSNLDILQAETTLNQNLTIIDELDRSQRQIITDLKTIMNDFTSSDYQFVTNPSLIDIPTETEIRTIIRDQNAELLLLQEGIDLAFLETELTKSEDTPILSSFGSLGYFFQRNDVQQLAQIQNVGPSIGVTLKYNLFDGGARKIKIQNAQMNQAIEAQKLQQREDELIMETRKEIQIINTLSTQLERERRNLSTYQLSYDKMLDRYNLGQVSELDLKESQLALQNSRIILSNLTIDIEKSKKRLGLIMGR